MSAPGDEIAAGASGHGRLRASHADREQVIGALKAAFVQGRLTKNEFDLRAGQVLASRTYGDLAALTADLPPGLTDVRPVRQAPRARPRPPEKVAKVAASVSLALAVLALAVFLGPGDGPGRMVGLAVFFIPVCGLTLGELLMLHSWLEKRSDRGQLPPRPASTGGAQASQHPLAAGPGRQLPPADAGHQHTEASRSCRIRRPLPGSRSQPAFTCL